jgi:hypothetical protein
MIRGRAAAWDRGEDPAWHHPSPIAGEATIKPLNQPPWERIWPLAATQSRPDRADWLLEAAWREACEREDLLGSRLRLAAEIAAASDGSWPGVRALRDRIRDALIHKLKSATEGASAEAQRDASDEAATSP